MVSIVITASTSSLLKVVRMWASRRDSELEFLGCSGVPDHIAGLYPAVRSFIEQLRFVAAKVASDI
jgi:hypothetical protein